MRHFPNFKFSRTEWWIETYSEQGWEAEITRLHMANWVCQVFLEQYCTVSLLHSLLCTNCLLPTILKGAAIQKTSTFLLRQKKSTKHTFIVFLLIERIQLANSAQFRNPSFWGMKYKDILTLSLYLDLTGKIQKHMFNASYGQCRNRNIWWFL